MAKTDAVCQEGTSDRGLAYLEMAVWCTVMVPVALLAAGIVGVVHDRIRMQQIPVSAVREYSAPALRLRMDGASGGLEINSGALQTVVRSIRERMVADSQRSLIGGITEISAVACFWVFRVDETTGRLTSREREVCERTGNLSHAISFARDLAEYQEGASGYPLFVPGSAPRYMEYTVLIGGAVGGKVRALSSIEEGELLQFVHISLPREEVSL